MIARLLADAVLVVHLAFVAFVVGGGLLVLRSPRWAAVHLPAAAWAVLVEYSGWTCPLTPLENALREQSGDAGYAGGFIDHYLTALLYPAGLTRSAQIALGTIALVVNAGIYLRLVRSARIPAKISRGGRAMADISKFRDLFDKKTFASLATVMPDGTPQVTPVWIDYDGKSILVNSARGRRKDKNMKVGAPVAIALIDPDNPYRHLQVRGRVTEVTEKGADEHIDRMAKKYLDKDQYPFRQPGEVRVLYKIEPQSASGM
jgi:PPOX class probable F420-dependent enzyme